MRTNFGHPTHLPQGAWALALGTAFVLIALAAGNSLWAATVVLQQGVNGYAGTADAWCNQGGRHDNYGADTNLQIKANLNGGGFDEDCGLARFALPTLTFGSLAGAELALFYETAHSFSDNNAMGIKPYRVGPTNAWYENSRNGQSGEGVSWLYFGQVETEANKWGYGGDPAVGPWNNKIDDGNGQNYIKKADGHPVQKTNAIAPLSWVPFDVRPSVLQWYGGQPNNGFLLFSSWWEGDGSIVWGEFTSREGATASHRPKLTLAFSGAQIGWGGYVNGTWDAGTANWNIGGYTGTYGDGDHVTFADGAGNPAISVSAVGVSPGSVTINNGAGTYSFSGGNIGGGGALTKQGTGLATLLASNSYAGLTLVKVGKLVVGANNALGAVGSGTVVSNGAALGLQGGVNYVGAEPVTIAGSGDGGGALYSAGASNAFAGPVTLAADSVIGCGSGRLSLGGIAAAGFGLSFNSAGDILVNGIISGTGSTLTKSGGGRLTLAGVNPNPFSGSTLIDGGTLILSGGATIASSPVIDVAAGATLDVAPLTLGFSLVPRQTLKGSGSVSGNVAAKALARLEPGDSAGTLTFLNNLSLAAGVTNYFELTNSPAIGGGTNDLVVVAGDLMLSGNVVAVTVLGPDSLGAGTYRLFNYAGAKSGSFDPTPVFLNGAPGPGRTAWIDETVTNQVNLVVAAPAGTVTSVSSAPNPSLPGAEVVLTATVTASGLGTNWPTGSVTFRTNTVLLGPPVPLVNGVAAMATTGLGHGWTEVRAEYPGDGFFLGSTGSVAPLVNTPPIPGQHVAYVMENERLVISIDSLLAGDRDPDGDALKLAEVSALSANNGTAAILNPLKIAYLPRPDYAGEDILLYKVSDPYTNVTVPINLNVLSAGDLAGSIVNVTNQAGIGITLTCAGIPGFGYLVEAVTNLTPPCAWQTLATNTADTNGLFQFTDVAATNVEGYYRTAIRANPPDSQMYDAELLKMEGIAGAAHAPIAIRESPTLTSQGVTAIEPQTVGFSVISSFFDVFTELSLDGGATWFPATNGPIPLILTGGLSLNEFPGETLPPLAGQYISPPDWLEVYPPRVVLKDLTLRGFSKTFPPPAPGETVVYSLSATMSMSVSFDGGGVFEPYSILCQLAIQLTGRQAP